MSFSIRRLREDDWRQFRSIRLQALQADPAVFCSNYEKEAALTEADWRAWLHPEDDAATFLVYEDHVPIGITGVAVDRDDPTKLRAILWGSWLEPRLRGRGLSNLMYAERIAWAKQHPTIQTISVSHRASNRAARQAILKHGFVLVDEVSELWPDGAHEEKVCYTLAVKSDNRDA